MHFVPTPASSDIWTLAHIATENVPSTPLLILSTPCESHSSRVSSRSSKAIRITNARKLEQPNISSSRKPNISSSPTHFFSESQTKRCTLSIALTETGISSGALVDDLLTREELFSPRMEGPVVDAYSDSDEFTEEPIGCRYMLTICDMSYAHIVQG